MHTEAQPSSQAPALRPALLPALPPVLPPAHIFFPAHILPLPLRMQLLLLLALASTQAPCEGGREGGQKSVGPLLSQVLGKDVVNFQQKELSEVPAEGWGEEG